MKTVTIKDVINEFLDEKTKCGAMVAMNMELTKEELKEILSGAKLTIKGVVDDDGYTIDQYEYTYNGKTAILEIAYYNRKDEKILLSSIHMYWKGEEE